MNTLVDSYVDTISKAPAPGSILKTYDGSFSMLRVQIDEGKPPFVYGRAYPSEVVDDSLGWYLRNSKDERNTGYKCILLSAARRTLTKLFPDEFKLGSIPVKSLRVIRVSESGRALLCEIHRYGVDTIKLSEALPLGSTLDEAQGLEFLREHKWQLTRESSDLEYGRVYFNCIDPNGTKVNLILS